MKKREIIYRAWESGRMYNDLAYITMRGKAMSMSPDVPLIRPILMQFTGLLDQNGKKIFEGDYIALHEYGDGVYKEVIFYKGSFCVHGFNWDVKRCTVIGNVYENPEL